jgi:hypothetical protein
MKPAAIPAPIPEGDPADCPRPAPEERPYEDVFDFLAAHGVSLSAAPKIKSYKTMDVAMRAILKSELIELSKDR